ncbi:MAG: DUF1800 domain-containing protein [Gammaproteobacteria bacterium]|nr:DUF1800 domain-containing protein [Gammaproteobacteria bacterium]
MNSLRLLLVRSFLCLFTLSLVACGGGGSSAPPVISQPPITSPPPPSVSISDQAASKFLFQTSFGPTQEDIDALSDMGYEAWIDQQMALPMTDHFSYVQALPEIRWREHTAAWFDRAVNSDDQLRQRVAFVLSEILVVSLHGVDFPDPEMASISLANYYDILLKHSFGNFRDLLEEVTLNPVMGEYLSMKGNQKAIPEENILPDENFAREMMQLFTIGLHELNPDATSKLDSVGQPIPTYDQETIEEMARVFTGWHFANIYEIVTGQDDRPDFMNPMIVIEERHDRGQKTVLGGAIIPAEQNADEDMTDMLDIVFNHPNVAPFISKQLIQKLVTSNPSDAFVQRVATVFENNGNGVRGDLKSVIKALLLDDEAITATTSADKIYGKLKEPLIRMAGLWRTFNAYSANGEYRLTYFNEFLGQSPLEAHHVFNFFSPFYSPQGSFVDNGWVAPEFEIHTEANQAKMTNFMQYLVLSQNHLKANPEANEILIDLSTEITLAENVDTLLDHYNLMLFGGDMSNELRTITKDFINTFPIDRPDQRAIEALGLLVVAPEFMVQD